MKILVTGGAGFIGSAVVRLAVARGHAVVNVDALTYAACLDNVAPAEGPLHAFERADIRDRAAMDRILGMHRPDAVLHLAAESHVDRSIDGPGAFVETNVTGTYTLLEAARAHWEREGRPEGFRFHHVSTDEVFGSLGPDDPPFTETTPYDPRSPYSASKAASDHLVRAWAETYGLPTLVTNCSNNYGPFHFPEKLVPVVILRALAGEPIPVYGAGENVRDWLYVEDHADALLTVLARAEPGSTYCVGGENEARNIDLVRTICAALDERRPEGAPHERLIAFVEDRPGHDARYAIDPARIRRDLGWRPSVTLAEGIARTVDWYLANEPWWRALQDRAGVGQRLGRAAGGPSADGGPDRSKAEAAGEPGAKTGEGGQGVSEASAKDALGAGSEPDGPATPGSAPGAPSGARASDASSGTASETPNAGSAPSVTDGPNAADGPNAGAAPNAPGAGGGPGPDGARTPSTAAEGDGPDTSPDEEGRPGGAAP